jgi:hypothetical protein
VCVASGEQRLKRDNRITDDKQLLRKCCLAAMKQHFLVACRNWVYDSPMHKSDIRQGLAEGTANRSVGSALFRLSQVAFVKELHIRNRLGSNGWISAGEMTCSLVLGLHASS